MIVLKVIKINNFHEFFKENVLKMK